MRDNPTGDLAAIRTLAHIRKIEPAVQISPTDRLERLRPAAATTPPSVASDQDDPGP